MVKRESREIRLNLAHRLSAIGLMGLAALSATHWLRDHLDAPGPVQSFALGIMPNLAAAFAMPLILASFTTQTSSTQTAQSARLRYLRVLMFTTLGLCGWEFIQARSSRFVFDIDDLLATALGSALAYVAFSLNARRFDALENESNPDEA